MSHTRISAFTHGAEEAQHWVNQVAAELRWRDDDRALRLLRTVLHALRDWLSIEELADFSSQLPLVMRGLLFENWIPPEFPLTDRSKADFVTRIQKDFSGDPLDDPDAAIAAVFRVIDGHISSGEARQVRGALRRPLQELWPVH